MAFLYPKLFPGCIAEYSGNNQPFSLDEAMDLFWRATSLNVSLTAQDSIGTIYTLNSTYSALFSLDDLTCGSQQAFGNSTEFGLTINNGAVKSGDLYCSDYLYSDAYLADSIGRRISFQLEMPNISEIVSTISFLGKSAYCIFYNDDSGERLSGSGSISIASRRTFD
jgi:hypothetical protein